MALTKDPDAVLDYTFDWSDWLAEGETILTHEAVIEDGDAVIDSTSQTASIVVVWLSGGTLGTNTHIRCRVTTTDGRIDDRTIVVLIREVFAVDGCEPWPLIGYTPSVGLDLDVLEAATQAAQAFLNGVAGGRFGTCTYTQRFQVRQTTEVCSATLPCHGIKLPNTPVQGVLGVQVDGALIAPSSYTLLGGSRLYKTDGCWPQSADNVPGRIVVTYTAGVPLRPGSAYYGMAAGAMAEMVGEYVNALNGQTCKLPSRFVAVARQGVSTQALDPELFLNLGMTGLPLTDNFIRTVNPQGHRRPPRVVSVDGPRRR